MQKVFFERKQWLAESRIPQFVKTAQFVDFPSGEPELQIHKDHSRSFLSIKAPKQRLILCSCLVILSPVLLPLLYSTVFRHIIRQRKYLRPEQPQSIDIHCQGYWTLEPRITLAHSCGSRTSGMLGSQTHCCKTAARDRFVPNSQSAARSERKDKPFPPDSILRLRSNKLNFR